VAKVAAFVDVEDWLPVVLAGITSEIASRIPDPLTSEFVRVIRTGGPGRRTRVSDVATVVVEAYAETETRASDLLRECAARLADVEGTTVDGVNVKTVTEVSGPGNLPTQTVSRSRYTQTFDLHLKGATS
jgi:hypothetical protein